MRVPRAIGEEDKCKETNRQDEQQDTEEERESLSTRLPKQRTHTNTKAGRHTVTSAL